MRQQTFESALRAFGWERYRQNSIYLSKTFTLPVTRGGTLSATGRALLPVAAFLSEWRVGEFMLPRMVWSPSDNLTREHEFCYRLRKAPYKTFTEEMLPLAVAGTLTAAVPRLVVRQALNRTRVAEEQIARRTRRAEEQLARRQARQSRQTHRRRLKCGLVGAGVTGSWVAPVLARVCPTVEVWDHDTVDATNMHGLWSTTNHSNRRQYKVAALARGGMGTIHTHRRRVEQRDLRTLDLVVLCPDNAAARVACSTARRVLDFRVTPQGLVIWAVTRPRPREQTEGSPWSVWLRSLEGYPDRQPCNDHHDNVPLQAGTMAAAFAGWWLTHGMPDGQWYRPYGFERITFAEDEKVVRITFAKDEKVVESDA